MESNYKNQMQRFIKKVNLDSLTAQFKKGSESLTSASKNLSSNIIKNVQDKSNELMNSIKHTKLRNLELLLKLDKSSIISSNKRCYIYQTSDKTIIVDLDMWGEPISITTKSQGQATVRTVKFIDDTPFTYPSFNEKNFFGQIIHLDENEIWYNDSGTIVMLRFIGNEPNVVKLNLGLSRDYSHKDLSSDPDLNLYLRNCSLTYRDKNLVAFIESLDIPIDKIFLINKDLIIHKNSDTEYYIYTLEGRYSYSNKYKLSKLPFTNERALTLLFSEEIIDYISQNNYKFEDFIFSNNSIEYWKYIGSKRICLLKCEVPKN